MQRAAGWVAWVVAVVATAPGLPVAAPGLSVVAGAGRPVVVPAPADPPPDVRGLTLPAATGALRAWQPATVITLEPATDTGVDPALTVVADALWATAPGVAASARPVVRLVLGRRVPDLTGQTLATASDALRPLALRPEPVVASPVDWLVATQRPAPGVVVPFGVDTGGVLVSLAAPPPARPEPDPDRGGLVLLVGSGLAVLVALAAVTVLVARRSRSSPATLSGPVRVRAVADPGTVRLVESDPDATVTVGLTAHHDPGTTVLTGG
jgi:hypothetical protein